ncbi:MAG: hypothetical protein IJQ15_06345 [Synergistaceae bacterium]|nr:hypothetical protein [Synergistaceae bacterium]
MLKLVFCAIVLLTVLGGTALASGHFWRCSFCGRGVNSDNCPPVGKCDKIRSAAAMTGR